MTSSVAFLSLLVVILLAITIARQPQELPKVFRRARSQLVVFGVRLPLAILSAAFISMLVPPDAVVPYVGPESGFIGILAAVAFGAVIPGGPILTFPLALVVWRSGAGQAQMIALLASWSVFAVHRIISYELPMLGPRFVALKLTSSGWLPIIAGLIAMGVLALWPR